MSTAREHRPAGSRRLAVVTGATSGIGEAIARRLATEGMCVTLVGRSDLRLEQATQRIRAAVRDAQLDTERADLSLMVEVRGLAERLADGPAPAVVISNAAVLADPADRTSEGLPTTLATNHLAPYLLLRSIVTAMGDRPARFVVVGADPRGLARVPVDLDDLSAVPAGVLARIPSLRPFAFYGRTKNMNAMFVYALARRLTGTQITVNGAHPGVIANTGLGRDARGTLRLMGSVLDRMRPGPDTGADTPAWLATSPEVQDVTGHFFARRHAVPTAAHTTDMARCDQLWNDSARLTGLSATL